jgi:hypothetical protein
VSDSDVNTDDDNGDVDGWINNDNLRNLEQCLGILVSHLHPMILQVFLK